MLAFDGVEIGNDGTVPFRRSACCARSVLPACFPCCPRTRASACPRCPLPPTHLRPPPTMLTHTHDTHTQRRAHRLFVPHQPKVQWRPGVCVCGCGWVGCVCVGGGGGRGGAAGGGGGAPPPPGGPPPPPPPPPTHTHTRRGCASCTRASCARRAWHCARRAASSPCTTTTSAPPTSSTRGWCSPQSLSPSCAPSTARWVGGGGWVGGDGGGEVGGRAGLCMRAAPPPKSAQATRPVLVALQEFDFDAPVKLLEKMLHGMAETDTQQARSLAAYSITLAACAFLVVVERGARYHRPPHSLTPNPRSAPPGGGAFSGAGCRRERGV